MSLVPKQRVVVKLKNSSGLLQQVTGSGASVKSTTLVGTGSGATRLDLLQDVVEGTPSNGDTLVYDSSTDKYRVGPPKGNFDGGFF
jgi:hypothetical protein